MVKKILEVGLKYHPWMVPKVSKGSDTE